VIERIHVYVTDGMISRSQAEGAPERNFVQLSSPPYVVVCAYRYVGGWRSSRPMVTTQAYKPAQAPI